MKTQSTVSVETERRTLAVCKECVKFGGRDLPVVYFIRSDANQDPEEWGLECPTHGLSEAFFVDPEEDGLMN